MSDFQKRVEGLSPKRLMLLALDLQSRLDAMQSQASEPIAVIGLGCRLPGAEEGPEAFWRLLAQGRHAIGEVPGDRWDAEAYFDENLDVPGRMSTRWGAFLSNIDQFDAPFFGIAGREANSMDPQQRMLLEVCWAALEHSGHSPRKLAGSSTGVFAGICGSDYQTMLLGLGEEAIDGYLASGTAHSIAAGRISYTLGLQGPSMAIDTACSASLVAVHLACQSLRARECSMALAGGVNAILSPGTTIALSKAHMMAPDGRCKTFDARADGFVRAEGCGVVVLKRLGDALADRDNILALIRGSAVNQDGRSSGITAPNGTAQEAVLRSAIRQAGVQPEEIGYVEAHGTGTALGDPIEAYALAAVYGPGRSPTNPLVLGSVKTNLGHMESAAGVVGLIKTIMALQHQQIPAHLNFQQLNPHIEWGPIPVEIPTASRPWVRGERRRIAGVSSFGFSGTNAHVVVEEAPLAEARKDAFERPQHLLTLTARNEAALGRVVELYTGVLEQGTADLGDVCYTANAGRAHFEHRLAVVGSTDEEMVRELRSAQSGKPVSSRSKAQIAFLFPGQGAQYAGMGSELYETQPAFRAALDECAEHLRAHMDRPLLDVLWGDAAQFLDETVNTQPALFAIEYSLARLWQSWGIEPGFVTGHSVGEYVAACIAGIFSLTDGLKLIAGRARLMQTVRGTGAMAAVWAGEPRVRAALHGLEDRLSIAAVNGPENVVISGYTQELERVEQRLREEQIQVQRLRTSCGFHSPQMREIEQAFELLAAEVQFASPRLPVLSSVTGQPVEPEEMSRPSYWRRQVSDPVRFQRVMDSFRERGETTFLEVGPGRTLTALGKENLGEVGRVWLSSLRRGRGECRQMLESLRSLYLQGADVDWDGFDAPYARRRVPLPTYPFQRQRCWVENLRPQRPSVRSEDRAFELPKGADRTQSTGPALPPAHWFYEVAWQSTAALGGPSLSSWGADAGQNGRAPRRFLIVSEHNELAAELNSRIRETGGEATLVSSPEALGTELRDAGYDLLLHVASSAANRSSVREQEGVPSKNRHLQEVLESAQAVLAHGRGPRLWIVTSGAQFAPDPHASLDLAQAPLWGFGKAFAFEHPGSWGGLVDLDPAAPASQCATELLSAVQKQNGEDQVAFRQGQGHVARLKHAAPPSGAPPTFASGKAYIITGGLGGLGLKLAEWMASHGARSLVLVGRSAPTEKAANVIEGLERDGVRVQVYAAHVDVLPQVAEVLHKVQETLAPIGGIFHAAGVLDDGIIPQQTAERFQKTLAPKADGAWNLHRLTAEMPLEYFVLFSSAASLIGSAGQASYAAANAYLDALARNRRAAGLPALSVNWGGWADVGMAARIAGQTRRPTEFALMPPPLALAALGQVLTTPSAQMGIAAVDWVAHTSLHGNLPFFRDLVPGTDGVAAPAGDLPLARQQRVSALLSAPPGERASRLTQHLVQTLAPTLGIDARTIDASKPVTEYGLDSLMALELRNHIDADFGVQISAVQLLRGLSLEEIAARIGTELPETHAPGTTPAVPEPETGFQLSFGQEQEWFETKFLPDEAPNNIGLTARACPRLEWPAFERAVSSLLTRHAALRTIFFEDESGIPMQRTLPSVHPDIDRIDADSLSDREIRDRISEDFSRPMPLDRPTFRLVVYRRAEEDVLFFKLDHIILDHWSVRLCIEDLKHLYIGEVTGTAPKLDPIGAEYREFVKWQRSFAEGAESEQHWRYWEQTLGPELPVLKLPSSRERPALLVSRGEALPLSFTSEHWPGIQRIAREYRATGYSLLLALFQVLLFRYTGQTDIVVGTSVSGREDPRWINTVGLFINVLALRCDLSGNPTFAEYLIRSRELAWDAFEHQAFPFSLLLKRIRQPRTLERVPIFQAFFNFLTDRSGALRSLFMGVEDCAVDFGPSKLYPFMVVPQEEGRLEVSLQLAEVDGRLLGFLNYNSDVLDPETAKNMAIDYCRLLDVILRTPNLPIADLLPNEPGAAPDREEIFF